ncbi:MAG: cobalamin-binding protein [Candidatus Rokuibacteriota bacterium]|nr:MAG: cobalamin-binding protein [Candidatus Rokubacteria bacterium]
MSPVACGSGSREAIPRSSPGESRTKHERRLRLPDHVEGPDLPQVLLSARAMYAGLDLLKPLITKAGGADQNLGVVVIGTAQGDLHDIGKNLVAMMLEGAGFKVHNLGRDVAPEKFVAAVQEHDARIVGISALMTTTMPAMKRTIDALAKAGLRERVKVMIGGAPVSQAYADEIGADGYARDSTIAVTRAKELLGVAAAT